MLALLCPIGDSSGALQTAQRGRPCSLGNGASVECQCCVLMLGNDMYVE